MQKVFQQSVIECGPFERAAQKESYNQSTAQRLREIIWYWKTN